MKVILAGGGTAGSVMPLLSIYKEIKKQRPDSEFLFVGTKKGEPERRLLQNYDIQYKYINGGKLRRYIDVRNISDILLTLIGFFQSLSIIIKFKPEIIVGAGGYISVPVVWAAWVLRKKILIHQQDIKPSLSNILCINLANRITVTFERSLRNFPAPKTIWTGNPVRADINEGSREAAYQEFELLQDLPLVVVMGGGTGALGLNTVVNQALPELVKFCQIVHLTGTGKRVSGIDSNRYQQYEFLGEEMKDLLAAADLIVSRAGLAAVTEFCILGKAVILVPLPKSHQEINAAHIAEKKAAIVMRQNDLSPGRLTNKIKELLNDSNSLMVLRSNIKKIMRLEANKLIAAEIIKLVER